PPSRWLLSATAAGGGRVFRPGVAGFAGDASSLRRIAQRGLRGLGDLRALLCRVFAGRHRYGLALRDGLDLLAGRDLLDVAFGDGLDARLVGLLLQLLRRDLLLAVRDR